MNISSLRLCVLAFTLLGLSSCCLDKVTLAPELTQSQADAAKRDTSIKATITLQFKDCCPSEKQKAEALLLQSKVSALYDRLISNQITLEDYNNKVKAAKETLETVIFVCNAHSGSNVPPPPHVTRRGATTLTLEQAWARVAELNRSLP